jgi:hypothetical protein
VLEEQTGAQPDCETSACTMYRIGDAHVIGTVDPGTAAVPGITTTQ